MTALPPTKGHLRLLQFSNEVADHTIALVCTQPDEPFQYERWEALNDAARGLRVTVRWFNEAIEQNPEAPGFWQRWRYILAHHGFQKGDYIIASEQYGVKFAEEMGGHFIPYDPYREILPIKATPIRSEPEAYFEDILPEFQSHLRQTVTLFGCESTGKSTLARALAQSMNGHYIPEWARPYMETCGNEMTIASMTDIWHGQRGLQRHARHFMDKPYVFQDTDLFSSIGYWNFWKPGTTPDALIEDALHLKSDLYLITQSNIPFEPDPLRFGGDRRESEDSFWIDLADKYELNYKIIQSKDMGFRLVEAITHTGVQFDKKAEKLFYKREYN